MSEVRAWIAAAALPLALLQGCGTMNAEPDLNSPTFRRTSQLQEELRPEQAQLLAEWAVPYARVASHVYCSYLKADDPEKARKEDCHLFPALSATGWAQLYDWRTILDAEELGSGLEFMAFGRAKPDSRGEIVIGFRGTDATSLADWRANLRWITRFLPLPGRDQYELVHRHAGQLVDQALAHAQAQFPTAAGFDVYSTGHSLGGGLAQLLAYSDARVKGAVVFDPTPVTGYNNLVTDRQVNCSARVVRFYERGEGLQYLRSVFRRFYSLSENIQEVSFDFIHTGGNPIANHSMTAFRAGLEAKAEVATTTALPVTPLPGRPDCDCYRLRQPETRNADAAVCVAVVSASP